MADHLAQQPIEDYQPMHPEFPDEDIMALFDDESEVDGSSNVLGHGCRAMLVLPDKKYFPFTTRLCFDCTNNMA